MFCETARWQGNEPQASILLTAAPPRQTCENAVAWRRRHGLTRDSVRRGISLVLTALLFRALVFHCLRESVAILPQMSGIRQAPRCFVLVGLILLGLK
jgi:hypothetical protein